MLKLNPAGVHNPPGYHHVTIAEAGRTAYLAGQCPIDVDGSLVGPGDHLSQTDQVVLNSLAVLAAAGSSPAEVVRSVIYVVSQDSSVLSAVWDRLIASQLGPAFSTASTLLGVTALGFTGQLVEVDLTAELS